MKNKKLIALLLIAAIVLGCATSAMADGSEIGQIVLSYTDKAGCYCEDCFYDQMPNPKDVAAFNSIFKAEAGIELGLTTDMTLGECLDKILATKIGSAVKGVRQDLTIRDMLSNSLVGLMNSDNPDQQKIRETLREFFGTDDPNQITDRQLKNFLVAFFSNDAAQEAFLEEGKLPFAERANGCQSERCKAEAFDIMLNNFRMMLSRLFMLFNYLNTGKIVY